MTAKTPQLSLPFLSAIVFTLAFPVTAFAAGGSSYTAAEQQCYALVQGKIAWDYQNTNRWWGSANVRRLCAGTVAPKEPGACYDRVMHGGTSWNQRRSGSMVPNDYQLRTKWYWNNAVSLCAGTNNSFARVGCFTDRLIRGDSWRTAIDKCAGRREAAPNCGGPEPMWDWTDSEEAFDVFPNSGVTEQCGGPFRQRCGVRTLTANDVQQGEGWVLLYKELGGPESGCATSVPKFVLYNKFTGILRIFYYIPHQGETFSHLLTQVSQVGPGPGSPRALFPFGRKDYTLENFDGGVVESVMHPGSQHQWTYADIPLIGYDPLIPDENSGLHFDLFGVNDTSVSLDGEVALEQTVEHVGGNVVGQATKLLTQGYNWYNSASSLQMWAGKQAADWATENSTTVPPALLALTNSPVVGVVAGLAGTVGSYFFGGSNGGGAVKFSGDLSLSGTMTRQSVIDQTFSLYLPGAPLLDAGSDKRPYYDQPIGVFNLRARPETSTRLVTGNPYYDEACNDDRYELGKAFRWRSEQPIVNPVGPKHYIFSYAPVWKDDLPTTFFPYLGTWGCQSYSEVKYRWYGADPRVALRMEIVTVPLIKKYDIMNVYRSYDSF